MVAKTRACRGGRVEPIPFEHPAAEPLSHTCRAVAVTPPPLESEARLRLALIGIVGLDEARDSCDNGIPGSVPRHERVALERQRAVRCRIDEKLEQQAIHGRRRGVRWPL